MRERTRVYVELGHLLDPHAWAQENTAGVVPSYRPFGLEFLETQFDVRYRGSAIPPLPERIRWRLNEIGAGLEWAEAALPVDTATRRAADVVLTWDEWSGIPAAYRSLAPGEPPVVSGIMNLTDWPELTRAQRAVLRRGMLATKGVFVHATAQAELLVSAWGIPRELISVVPFGVDTDFFRPMPVAVDRDLVVTVGDDAHRDYVGLGRIFADIHRRRPDTTLLAATTRADAELDQPGVTLVREKLGSRRPAIYSSAAVVAVHCHPQIHGSGLSVIAEAMACGRPFVATDSIGFSDHFPDEPGGIFVPAGDDDAFAAAVLSLLDDPAAADEMGRRGRKVALERLSTGVQTHAVAEVLRSALDR